MLQGGCFCGHVRYSANDATFNETNCHCSICRRTSGAPFVAWFSARAESFKFVSGDPHFFASSEHGQRTFCPRCGTPLTFRSTHYPDELDVTICSLEDPERVLPKDHIHTEAKLNWIRLDDGLPGYRERRSSSTSGADEDLSNRKGQS